MTKHVRTSLFFISFLWVFGQAAFSQDKAAQKDAVVQNDSVVYPEQFGIRVGVDLSKPIRSLIDENYKGFEILGDMRIYEDYYLAAEFGNERFLYDEANLQIESKGSYFKIGADYNAYNNWLGMENIIFVGLRYGFATFNETLKEYTIYSSSSYFEPDVRVINKEFKDLTASWLEFQFGIKAEVLHNVYLGIHAELKRRLSQQTPPNISNVYIPGFHKTYEGSKFGVGWGYSISYMIPIYSKKQNKELPEENKEE